jgi:hypothetical protein
VADRLARPKRSKPRGEEIEITPEMIEAGSMKLFLNLPWSDQYPDLDWLAEEVFKAMLRARKPVGAR